MNQKDFIELFNSNKDFAEEVQDYTQDKANIVGIQTVPDVTFRYGGIEEDPEGESNDAFNTFTLNNLLFGFEGWSTSYDREFEWDKIIPLEEREVMVRYVFRKELEEQQE